MNFESTMQASIHVMETGLVPIIIGERGIGKTALAREAARVLDYGFVVIEANTLKEGEIGGLPTLVKRELSKNERKSFFRKFSSQVDSMIMKKGDDKLSSDTIKNYTTSEYNKMKLEIAAEKLIDSMIPSKVDYAVHTKFLEIEEALTKHDKVILLIDEINRCHNEVRQEIMNVIFREINGYKISDRVLIIGTMNPSSDFQDSAKTEYQVQEFDDAQKDRFIWLEMDADKDEWIKWGIHSECIEPEILEFLATANDTMFNNPDGNETISPSPRSWENVSKILKRNKEVSLPDSIFYQILRGSLGKITALEFRRFLGDRSNPLPKPEEIFTGETLEEGMKKRIMEETLSRMNIIARNCIKYLSKMKKIKDGETQIMVDILSLIPKDLALSIMKDVIKENKALHNKLVDLNDNYLTFFEDINSLVTESTLQ